MGPLIPMLFFTWFPILPSKPRRRAKLKRRPSIRNLMRDLNCFIPSLFFIAELSFFSNIFDFLFSTFDQILPEHALVASVWDWDRFTQDDFLGYVVIPLSDLKVGETFCDCFPLRPKPGTSSLISVSFA